MWSTMMSLVVLLGMMCVAVRADFDLTVIHTNDIHARVEEADKRSGPCSEEQSLEGKCFGGVARIRTKVDEIREANPNSILLDAGDQFQGTLWFYVFGGEVMSMFMNLLGYDAMAIGNHEFDSGLAGLAPFVHNLTFPILASNIDFSASPALRDDVQRSTVVEVGGEKIGVVGYTTTDTPFLSSTETATFTEELSAIQSEVDRLTEEGINKIIALGHSGFAMDIELAKHLRNVDLVVGGHTNTFLYTGEPPSDETPESTYPTVETSLHTGQDVLVIQDYAYGKYLGELHVTFNDEGIPISWSGNPVLLDNSVPRDPEALAIIQAYAPEIEELKSTVIGTTHVSLVADRVTCRTTECNIGNLITNAFVRANLRHPDGVAWADVGIAIVNAGSFRASISSEPGPITMQDVIYVQPFRNTVDVVSITGQTILEVFEFNAEHWSTDSSEAFGAFLQVAGLQVTYDMERPVGQRVVEVQAICTDCLIPQLQPLDPQAIYKIIMTSYIASGGDGYYMFPDAIVESHLNGDIDTDMLLEYIKEQSPITVGLEGRIRHLSSLTNSLYCSLDDQEEEREEQQQEEKEEEVVEKEEEEEKEQKKEEDNTEEEEESFRERVNERLENARERVGEGLENARERLGEGLENARESLGDFGETVGEKLENMRETAGEKLGDLRESLSEKWNSWFS